MAFVENTTTPHDVSTDASFRTWGSMISALLASAGLTKMSDTGTIDWATVVGPAINTYAGFEVWRFNDAEQATTPVFIKLEYGRGGVTTRAALRVDVGSATNGSGTLSGAAGTTGMIHSGTPSGNGIASACYDGTGFALHDTGLTGTGATARQLITVERLRDAASGALSGDLTMITYLTNNVPTVKTRVGGTWDTTGGVVTLPPSKAISGKMLFGSIRVTDVPALPLRTMLLGDVATMAVGDTGAVVIAGTTKNYKVMASPIQHEHSGQNSASALTMMTTD